MALILDPDAIVTVLLERSEGVARARATDALAAKFGEEAMTRARLVGSKKAEKKGSSPPPRAFRRSIENLVSSQGQAVVMRSIPLL